MQCDAILVIERADQLRNSPPPARATECGFVELIKPRNVLRARRYRCRTTRVDAAPSSESASWKLETAPAPVIVPVSLAPSRLVQSLAPEVVIVIVSPLPVTLIVSLKPVVRVLESLATAKVSPTRSRRAGVGVA